MYHSNLGAYEIHPGPNPYEIPYFLPFPPAGNTQNGFPYGKTQGHFLGTPRLATMTEVILPFVATSLQKT